MNNIDLYLICPITKGLMIDPVIAEDGYSYERKAIEKFIDSNMTSPKSKIELKNKLIPNRNLKLIIEEMVSKGKVEEKLCADYKEKKDNAKEEENTISDKTHEERINYEKMKENQRYIAWIMSPDHPRELEIDKELEVEHEEWRRTWWWW